MKELKRAPSAYNLYISENASALGVKGAADKWKTLSAAEKLTYDKQAEELRVSFMGGKKIMVRRKGEDGKSTFTLRYSKNEEEDRQRSQPPPQTPAPMITRAITGRLGGLIDDIMQNLSQCAVIEAIWWTFKQSTVNQHTHEHMQQLTIQSASRITPFPAGAARPHPSVLPVRLPAVWTLEAGLVWTGEVGWEAHGPALGSTVNASPGPGKP